MLFSAIFLNIASTTVLAPDKHFLFTFFIDGILFPSILPIRVTSLSKSFYFSSLNGSLSFALPGIMVFISGFIYLFNRRFFFRHGSSVCLLGCNITRISMITVAIIKLNFSLYLLQFYFS